MDYARSKLGLLFTAITMPSMWLAAPSDADAAVAYLRSEAGGAPWATTDNEQAMDLVFGAGAWEDLRFETVDAVSLFSPTYTFLYLEGSDAGADELQAFLTANQGALEGWVIAGGKLFLNAGPNEGTGMAWGFTGVSLVTAFPADPSMPYDATHQIWQGPFTPVNPVVSGSSFAHANVTGGGLTPLIVDPGGLQALTELPAYGEGVVIFGGLTTSGFWFTPEEGLNLRANVLWYLGQDDADVDGIIDSLDNCVAIANPEQENGDRDLAGDLCDVCPADPLDDADGDIVCGDVDNCPDVLNFNQADADRDAIGDVCDPCPDDADADADADADGVCGALDNCPDDANDDQADADGDGIGDACDDAGSSGPDGSGGPDDSGGPQETGDGGQVDATGNDSAGTEVSAGLTDGSSRGGDDGCGCRAPARGGDALWLAAVLGGLLRRRRARTVAGVSLIGVVGCFSPEDPTIHSGSDPTTTPGTASSEGTSTSEAESSTTMSTTASPDSSSSSDDAATSSEASTDGESSSGTGTSPGVCGDGSVDADEQCDDGNLVPGDLCDGVCAFESVTFVYTGATETLAVPAWVDTLRIDASGAQGGGGYCCEDVVQDDGGLGGHVAATLATLGGLTLEINVGGQGVTQGAGGYNGGGAGGQWGAGGGGASDVRVGPDVFQRILVAGGGGGGNCGCPDFGTGGGGGGLEGVAGSSDEGTNPGGGGTQDAGGAPGDSGTAGVLGQGGSSPDDLYHVAGGGGGYYGGGGAEASGAGGGSSYYGPASDAETTAAVRAGDGEIVITPTASL